MKKLMEQLGAETFLGGLFGVIAILAVFAEMALAGFDAAAVAGGVKDIAGTIVTVIMLVVAIRALRPKEEKGSGFDAVFEGKMKELAQKYSPMLGQWDPLPDGEFAGKLRYTIASRLDCLTTDTPGEYHKFFYIKEGDSETAFSVTPTVFRERTEAVIANIKNKIYSTHGDFVKDARNGDKSFVLTFFHPLQSEEDAEEMAKIVDHILLLYAAEYSRKK